LRVARRVKSISLWTGGSSTASGRASHLIAFFGKVIFFGRFNGCGWPLSPSSEWLRMGCESSEDAARHAAYGCKKGVHQISIGPYKRPQTPSVTSVQSIPLVYLFL
jgi:hypothetical protein